MHVLAERRKPPGSGANACGPGAKNVGVKTSGFVRNGKRLGG
jgi:hypothetical protein